MAQASFEERILAIYNGFGGKWFSLGQIAGKVGCSSGNVRYHLRKHGLKTMRQVLNEERLTPDARERMSRGGWVKVGRRLRSAKY